MKIGAFEIIEPIPNLVKPHVISILYPWVDAGSAGTLTLARMEEMFQSTKLGELSRPGDFFDFTRYRPTTYLRDGERLVSIPNTSISYAQREGFPDLIFINILEPHHMAEDYIDSLLKLFEFFDVQRHCRVGAMWNAVPHTRPLLLTGQASGNWSKKLADLVTQRQSIYEGPSTIMGLLNIEQANRDIESISIMTHLPQYLQLEEDYSGAARLLEALGALYDINEDFPEYLLGVKQYEEFDIQMENSSATKNLIDQLEQEYDNRTDIPQSDHVPQDDLMSLSPDVQQFLIDAEQHLDQNDDPTS
jgi:hypothetical protein